MLLVNLSANDFKLKSDTLSARKVVLQESLKSCKGCHGKNFERSAMRKSKIVKDMNATAIYEGLKGYQEDKGGPLKNIMKNKVIRYNDTDLKIIAEEISSKE
jgi:cytochrome c553